MNRASRILSPRMLWQRSSGITRLALYLGAVEIFLLFVQELFRITGSQPAVDALTGWIRSLAFTLIFLIVILELRWVRRKLMWSLRNRLIVTYIFIGVIPVILLMGMGAIAGLFLSGQFATFLATTDIQTRLENLATANEAIGRELAVTYNAGLPSRPALVLPQSARFPGRSLTVWYKNRATFVATPGADMNPVSVPPGKRDFSALVKDGDRLYLRSVTTAPLGTEVATIISSVPLDQQMLESITGGIGQVTISDSSETSATGKQIIRNDLDSADSTSRSTVSESQVAVQAGTVPPSGGRFDQSIDFITKIPISDWRSGEIHNVDMLVSSRRSLLLRRLFANLGANANAILMFLAAIAIALGILELLALWVGVRLTRTMTGSVSQLYKATQHINSGDLNYRIQVRNHDQLAELETSFNAMSQSLERLLSEQKEKQRIESELAIAQEVQAQLFPTDFSGLESLELQGACRPARRVSGDYYDFLRLGGEKLGIAVGDVSGKGISAALLMATIHSAVRVYETGRVPARQQLVAAFATTSATDCSSATLGSTIDSPAMVLSLLNRHLFHSTPAEKYATMFIGLWDGRTRTLTYSNGGHLPPLIVRQDGSVEKLDAGGTVVGLFDEASYEESTVELRPGDLFVAYSDGLTEPENEFGEFGEQRLIEVVRDNRNLPLPRMSEAVLSSVLDWIGADEQPDDMTLVLARAN